VPVTEDLATRISSSRDYAWLSPVLEPRLPERPADLVAWPTDGEQLAACVGEAVECSVPVTLRGRGTGNYGQSVPLEGGLLIDTRRLDSIVDIADGVARVEPGVTCRALEREARRHGQELALFPSTTSSTLGGFVSGGAGGSGSIEHGFVWDGFVTKLEVLPATSNPIPLRFASEGDRPPPGGPVQLPVFLHTYGTVGVISELSVCLDPKRHWSGLSMSFPSIETAVEAGHAMLSAALDLRLLGVSEASLVSTFPAYPWLRGGASSLRAVIRADQVEEAASLGRASRGTVDGAGDSLVDPITQLSYNHVTLRAKLADRRICHLQIGAFELEKHLPVVRTEFDEARIHLDAMRGPSGLEFGGLLLCTYRGERRLRAGMSAAVAAGLRVVDPHTWGVADPVGAIASAALVADPHGLLNPGKLDRLPGRGLGASAAPPT
jgi:FAD binding domain